MTLNIPAICLNPILTKVLESDSLAHIWLESPWKVVCGTAIGLPRYVVGAKCLHKDKGLDRWKNYTFIRFLF